ncbi:MAG: TRAP transporter small permease [Desulfobacterales bacterium]|nr:MAG: TRAP transporter small permease [Desulfobacterales bacterium]
MEQVLAHGGAVFALAMMLLTVIEITLRKILGYSIEGVFEAVELMLVIIVYLGLARVQYLGKNVRVEILLSNVPFKVRQALEAFTMLLSLAFFSLAVYMTGKKAWASWLIRETTFLPAELPIWAARGVITIGLFFLSIRLLIQIGECIYNLIGPPGKNSGDS